MKAIQAKAQEWLENGPDPLVIPDEWEVYNYADRWEHKVVEAMSEHPLDLEKILGDYERQGWQFAGAVCHNYPTKLIFKRPAPLED